MTDPKPAALPAPNSFEIDLGAVRHNVRAIRGLVGPKVWLCAALKADAYGFGLIPVAETSLSAGADALSVGSLGDAIQMRGRGIRAPVLVYAAEVLDAVRVAAAERWDLIVTVHDAESLAASLKWAQKRLGVFLEVDVGLQRLGFAPKDVPAAIDAIRRSERLQLRGVYTHMRVVDGEQRDLEAQFHRFETVTGGLDPAVLRMAASSRVLDQVGGMTLTAVDPGRAIYGLLAKPGGRLGPDLRPAFAALKTTLIAVKAFEPDRWPTGAPTSASTLGVIPFGRAHGMGLLDAGNVLVRGRPATIMGPPSLEHTRIDLSAHPDARVGDEVVIVGKQGSGEIRIAGVLLHQPELSETAIALGIGRGVARTYIAG